MDEIFDNLIFSKLKENDYGKMKCDIYEKNDIYYLEIDIPGFNKEDIRIDVDNNDYLTIIAEKSLDELEDDKNYIRKERNYGKYQRCFYVGGIDKNKIEATFLNGILKVIMPKKEEKESSKYTIEIK